MNFLSSKCLCRMRVIVSYSIAVNPSHALY